MTLKLISYNGTHLRFKMGKTGGIFVIKVPTVGRRILDVYAKGKQANDYLLPFIDNAEYSKMELSMKVASKTATVNLHLKEIAKEAKIEKKVTTHISRHSYASRALMKGIGIEYVQRLLGHSDLKTTQIYAKVVNKELDKAVDLFG